MKGWSSVHEVDIVHVTEMDEIGDMMAGNRILSLSPRSCREANGSEMAVYERKRGIRSVPLGHFYVTASDVVLFDEHPGSERR